MKTITKLRIALGITCLTVLSLFAYAYFTYEYPQIVAKRRMGNVWNILQNAPECEGFNFNRDYLVPLNYTIVYINRTSEYSTEHTHYEITVTNNQSFPVYFMEWQDYYEDWRRTSQNLIILHPQQQIILKIYYHCDPYYLANEWSWGLNVNGDY